VTSEQSTSGDLRTIQAEYLGENILVGENSKYKELEVEQEQE
jgi:hypothetical protein